MLTLKPLLKERQRTRAINFHSPLCKNYFFKQFENGNTSKLDRIASVLD